MIDVALFYQEIRAETLQHLHLFLHCSKSFALQTEEQWRSSVTLRSTPAMPCNRTKSSGMFCKSWRAGMPAATLKSNFGPIPGDPIPRLYIQTFTHQRWHWYKLIQWVDTMSWYWYIVQLFDPECSCTCDCSCRSSPRASSARSWMSGPCPCRMFLGQTQNSQEMSSRARNFGSFKPTCEAMTAMTAMIHGSEMILSPKVLKTPTMQFSEVSLWPQRWNH